MITPVNAVNDIEPNPFAEDADAATNNFADRFISRPVNGFKLPESLRHEFATAKSAAEGKNAVKGKADDIESLRHSIDVDRKRLCDALGMKADGKRYFCPRCQADGEIHETGDLSIEAGFTCFRCHWKGNGFSLVQEVRNCDIHEARAFVREVYGMDTKTPQKRAEDAPKTKTVHRTLKDAARAAAWGAQQNKGIGYAVTRTDIYRNAAGVEVAAVLRLDAAGGKAKEYRPLNRSGTGWSIGDPSGAWPLFRLPEIVATSGPVVVCEGEKAASAGAGIGLNCTTSAHGAGSSTKTDWTPLMGRDIVILPDNDDAGRGYAEAVSELSRNAGASSIKIVNLPGLPHNGDLVEFIANGGTAADVMRLANETPTMEFVADDKMTPTPEGKTDPIAAAAAGTPYEMTDLGNAERLIAWFGDVIRWDVPRKVWRLWDGRRWKADTALKVLQYSAASARRIRKEAGEAPSNNGQADLAGELWKHALRSESREKLSACVEVAKSLSGIAVDASAWDRDPMRFNCKNGTIDLHTGELKPHDKTDLITRLSPIAYDASAKCDRWETFLRESTGGNIGLIDFLHRATGYTLTGKTIEEVLFLIFGVTASGKTTFLETLKFIMGEYATTIDPAMLCKSKYGGSTGGNATPELARLDGVRLAGGSEMEQGRELAEAVVKNITGGETITARHLYADIFQFVPQFKLWLALNHCPKASADDGAIWRRMLRINFDKSVPAEKRDKTLKPYLQNEGAQGVLAWAVQGCIKWQAEGLGVPACVQESTEAYKAESDPLANFFEDCVQLESWAWTSNSDIHTAYKEHCDDNGVKFPVSNKRISEHLQGLGCKPDKRGGARGWEGVLIKPDWPLDTVDRLDSIPESFSHVAQLEKGLGVSVQSVQSVQEPELLQENIGLEEDENAELYPIVRR